MGIWKHQICRHLNKMRNYVQGQTFTHVKKFIKTYGRDKFPTLEEILKVVGRSEELLPPDEDASQDVKDQHERLMFVAKWFVNCFLAQVAGASTWWREGIRKTYTISEAKSEGYQCVPISSEAMAALFFENGATAEEGTDADGNPLIGKWFEYANWTNDWTEKKPLPRSGTDDKDGKYQGRYSTSNSGSSTFGGWKDEGLIRYEALLNFVEAARAKPHCAAVEKEILRRMRKDIWKTERAPGEEEQASRKTKTKKVSAVKLSLRI